MLHHVDIFAQQLAWTESLSNNRWLDAKVCNFAGDEVLCVDECRVHARPVNPEVLDTEVENQERRHEYSGGLEHLADQCSQRVTSSEFPFRA